MFHVLKRMLYFLRCFLVATGGFCPGDLSKWRVCVRIGTRQLIGVLPGKCNVFPSFPLQKSYAPNGSTPKELHENGKVFLLPKKALKKSYTPQKVLHGPMVPGLALCISSNSGCRDRAHAGLFHGRQISVARSQSSPQPARTLAPFSFSDEACCAWFCVFIIRTFLPHV